MSAQLKKILYIDDDFDLLAVVKMTLEELGGFTVATCSSGNQGVNVAKDWLPDLIMLDVMMPVVDGPATLKLLRATEGVDKIPVVFMTARTLGSQIDGYRSLGALGTIAKPFDPMQLPGEVEKLWLTSRV